MKNTNHISTQIKYVFMKFIKKVTLAFLSDYGISFAPQKPYSPEFDWTYLVLFGDI